MRRWLVKVRAGARGKGTRATYVDAHRRAAATVYRWAVREGLIERSPFDRVERVKGKRREIVILQPDEVAALMRAASQSELGARDRAIIAFMYDNGARVGEVAGIRVADLDLAAGTCVVRGKTGEGIIPISMELRSILLAYMRSRPRAFPWADDGLLFPARRGGPLTPNAIKTMIRRAAQRAGISKRVYPHLMRHTFGTHFKRNGGDSATLQRILRHTTTATTRLYEHLAMDDVQAEHQVRSPLARLGNI